MACIETTQNHATAKNKGESRSGSKRKTQNPARVDSGIPHQWPPLQLTRFYIQTKILIRGKFAKPEVFGWSRIPKNTTSRSRILYPTPGSPIESFLHHTPKLRILPRAC